MVQISKNNNEISIDTLEKKRKLMHLVLKSKALGKGTTLSPTKSFNFHYVTRQLDKLSLIDNRVPDLGGSKSNRLRYR